MTLWSRYESYDSQLHADAHTRVGAGLCSWSNCRDRAVLVGFTPVVSALGDRTERRRGYCRQHGRGEADDLRWLLAHPHQEPHVNAARIRQQLDVIDTALGDTPRQ